MVDVFQALNGEWVITRRITPGGCFTGQGVFKKIGDGNYLYSESGIMVLDSGAKVEAYRSYLYVLEGDRIGVYFNDGPDKSALFHYIDIDEKNDAVAVHFCGEDVYKTSYAFNLPTHFSITHDVCGPKKKYTSFSKFTR